MDLLVLPDYEALSREAARRVAVTVLLKPKAVLAFPTGGTPLGMYRRLIQLVDHGLLDLSQAVIFNLDELLDIPPDHPCSYATYMREHFLKYVKVGAHHIPNSLADPIVECKKYEELIAQYGGIDLAILGLGPNGHIAFNEPGTPFETFTHVAELSQQTREALAGCFEKMEEVPKRAITMGIRTIMNARHVILLASGKKKAAVVRDALLGSITPKLPASVLRLHPNLLILLDEEAASALSSSIRRQNVEVSRDLAPSMGLYGFGAKQSL
jgi:glucosamine-6-phosphate deaminase